MCPAHENTSTRIRTHAVTIAAYLATDTLNTVTVASEPNGMTTETSTNRGVTNKYSLAPVQQEKEEKEEDLRYGFGDCRPK